MDFVLNKNQKREIQNIKNDSSDLEKIIDDINISDQQDLDLVVSLIQEYKEKIDYLEDDKKEFTDPLKKITTKVDKLYNPLIKQLKTFSKLLKKKIINYEQNQKQKIFKGKKVNIAKNKNVSYRSSWDFEIENVDDVPLEFLSVDISAVKIAIRESDGKVEIPGIHIFRSRSAVVK